MSSNKQSFDPKNDKESDSDDLKEYIMLIIIFSQHTSSEDKKARDNVTINGAECIDNNYHEFLANRNTSSTEAEKKDEFCDEIGAMLIESALKYAKTAKIMKCQCLVSCKTNRCTCHKNNIRCSKCICACNMNNRQKKNLDMWMKRSIESKRK